MFKATYFFLLFSAIFTIAYSTPTRNATSKVNKVLLENGNFIENNIVNGVHYSHPENPQIGKIIMDSFNNNPNHVAQIDAKTKEETTFAEMKDRSIRLAIWLKRQNVGLGDVITLSAPKRLDNYIPYVAALFVGAVYYPWHHGDTFDDIRKSMKLLRPKVMFIVPESVELFKEAAMLENVNAKIICFDKHDNVESLNDILSSQSLEDVMNFEVDEIKDAANTPCTIIPTSGSTGIPKNVVHSYKSMVTNFMEFNMFPVENSRFLTYTTPYWISDISLLLRSIKHQATKIFHQKFDVVETANVIDEYKIDYIFSHPVLMASLVKSEKLESQKKKFHSLLKYQISGAVANEDILSEFNKILPHVLTINCIGMTEAAFPLTSQTNKKRFIDSLGFLMPNIKMKVIDLDTKDILGANMPGELCYKMPVMMLGYYKNDVETNLLIDSEGWLHSGDIGYYDETGEVFFLDRIKDLIQQGVVSISGNKLAKILEKHADVLEAIVIATPHEIDGERATAFVKISPGSKVTKEELIEMSFQNGKEAGLLGGLFFVDEFPRLLSGKVAKKKLKEMAVQFNKNNVRY